MENKGIPLISINNRMKEHDKKVVLGANANTKMGHVKGRPWNHIHTSSNSGASASAYASEDGGYTNLTGFSWPPRLYVCSFCKREFRSAQALGGHMNVHRRDRARLLRQSPPKELLAGIGPPPVNTVADYSNNLNFVANPNPNLIQSSPLMNQKINTKTATNYITHFSKIPSSLKSSISSTSIISSPSRTHASGMMRWSAACKSNPLTATSAATRTPNLYDAYNNNFQQHVNINKAWEKQGGLLRMGFRTSELRKEEDAVDLELRLGYSS